MQSDEFGRSADGVEEVGAPELVLLPRRLTQNPTPVSVRIREHGIAPAWLLEESGVKYERVNIDIRDESSRGDAAFRAASPMGTDQNYGLLERMDWSNVSAETSEPS